MMFSLSSSFTANSQPPALHDDAGIVVAWQSPSNIAFIKYWGKRNGQYPVNPSLSMTLDRAYTTTRVNLYAGKPVKGLVSVNGDPLHPFLPKMQHLFRWIAGELPVFRDKTLEAVTVNSFPHSTGIASSASGISAFTLCLLDLAGRLTGVETASTDLMRLASCVARLGSGSACRSIYGGYAVWGESPDVPGSSDEMAIPVTELVHPDLLNMKDAILVISADPKSLPSSAGHQAMVGHPFLTGRITQANRNLQETMKALSANDFEKLSVVAENEALTLHALIMSADPGTLLMKPATVEVIRRVREARSKGLPLFFTLDAGANVHALYPGYASAAVEQFIRDELQPLCENGLVIFDQCGAGPKNLVQ